MRNLNPIHFNFKITSDGYQVIYKGHPIGGAGVMLPSIDTRFRRSVKIKSADIKMYSEMAQREIQSLLNGFGRPDMKRCIQEINKSLKMECNM